MRAHVYASGRVQGVFFRQETLRQAVLLGVGGWVRNLPDGRVEAALEGRRDQVGALLDWMRRGPRAAVVSGVETTWENPVGEGRFRVR